VSAAFGRVIGGSGSRGVSLMMTTNAITSPLRGLSLLAARSSSSSSLQPKRTSTRTTTTTSSSTASSFVLRTSKAFLATDTNKSGGDAEEGAAATPAAVGEDAVEEELVEEEVEDAVVTTLGVEIEAIKEATRIVSGLPISAIEDYEVEVSEVTFF